MHRSTQHTSKPYPQAYRSETNAILCAATAEDFGGCVWSDDLRGPIYHPYPEVT